MPRYGLSELLTLACAIAAPFVSAAPDLADYERATNRSLLWGPYRPNLYFGIRPRVPDSLLMGLLWARVEDYESIQHNFRYTCEQNEGMAGYGWDRYDPRFGGVQTIHDAGNKIDITTSFVKDTTLGENGGNWAVRIRGTPRADADENLVSSVIFSIASPGKGLASLEVAGERELLQDPLGLEGDVTIKGEDPTLGKFSITVTEGKGEHPKHGHPSGQLKHLDRSLVSSGRFPEKELWQSRNIMFAQMKRSVDADVERYGQEDLPPPFQFYTVPNEAGPGNQHFVQKVFKGSFEFDILYSADSAGQEMTSEALTKGLKSNIANFDKKFKKHFDPQAPFADKEHDSISKSLFSNLLGGIGYFHGDSLADRSFAEEYEETDEGFWEAAAEARSRAQIKREGPSELFSAVPSRPFFPRGFLWDEGFHLIPILEWDVDLALEIVRSWFSLIDEDGWIGREQILGDEARSKVPAEFQVQYPHYANPPTLFLILTSYIDRLSKKQVDTGKTSLLLNDEAAKKYLSEIYPLLKRHYDWFRRTQSGDLKTYEREPFSMKEGYRWRGRTLTHCLPSGFDDYPRADPPHPGELHVDAMSWVGLMAQNLRKIAQFLGETDDVKKLSKQEEAITRNLVDLHWDEKEGVFCDATIDTYEEDVHVCHKGYVSLTPFFVGLLKPDDKKIGRLLDVLSDPNELWTDFGIRSLSKSDVYYGTAENYWRSPIWMPVNYLIVRQLYELGRQAGPHQARSAKLYNRLRENLVNTVSKSWKETGFAWEQYNPDTGAGQRNQHFTGWTSLAVNLMAMPALTDGLDKDEL